MLNLVFSCLCAVYLLLFPFKKLKLTKFALTLVQIMGLGIVSLAHLVPEWGKILIIGGMMINGMVRGNVSLIYLVSFENLRGNENPSMFNLWSILSVVRHAYMFVLGWLCIYVLEWNWSASLIFYNVIFLVSSLLFYDLLEEVEIETES